MSSLKYELNCLNFKFVIEIPKRWNEKACGNTRNQWTFIMLQNVPDTFVSKESMDMKNNSNEWLS